ACARARTNPAATRSTRPAAKSRRLMRSPRDRERMDENTPLLFDLPAVTQKVSAAFEIGCGQPEFRFNGLRLSERPEIGAKAATVTQIGSSANHPLQSFACLDGDGGPCPLRDLAGELGAGSLVSPPLVGRDVPHPHIPTDAPLI